MVGWLAGWLKDRCIHDCLSKEEWPTIMLGSTVPRLAAWPRKKVETLHPGRYDNALT